MDREAWRAALQGVAKSWTPVNIGDVLIEDCAGTGIPVVATKAVGAV